METSQTEKLGLLVLGQTPRKDLVDIYATWFPEIEFVCKGALDDLAIEEISSLTQQVGKYPLMVLLKDRSVCNIAMPVLFPYLEQAIHDLLESKVDAVAVMCSAAFPDFDADSDQIIIPHKLLIASATAGSLKNHIGIISPIREQQADATAAWTAKGFRVSSSFASPWDREAMVNIAEYYRKSEVDLIIFDCLGVTEKMAETVSQISCIPGICPQELLLDFFKNRIMKPRPRRELYFTPPI